jgi:hypothetical protein
VNRYQRLIAAQIAYSEAATACRESHRVLQEREDAMLGIILNDFDLESPDDLARVESEIKGIISERANDRALDEEFLSGLTDPAVGAVVMRRSFVSDKPPMSPRSPRWMTLTKTLKRYFVRNPDIIG